MRSYNFQIQGQSHAHVPDEVRTHMANARAENSNL